MAKRMQYPTLNIYDMILTSCHTSKEAITLDEGKKCEIDNVLSILNHNIFKPKYVQVEL